MIYHAGQRKDGSSSPIQLLRLSHGQTREKTRAWDGRIKEQHSEMFLKCRKTVTVEKVFEYQIRGNAARGAEGGGVKGGIRD